MTLRFRVEGLREELRTLNSIASDFLDPTSAGVLAQLERELDGISSSRSSDPHPWCISEGYPLLTQASIGQYQPADEGGKVLFGEVTFRWDLLPILEGIGAKQPARFVDLVGVASTVVRILEGEPEQRNYATELAMWRMEVGNLDSPGTHFHVQVLGRESDELFPHAMDVPRLPSLLISPFACAEYVISELFQDAWRRVSSKESGPMRLWRGLQASRFRQQLKWHLEVIDDSSGSPWTGIKTAKPSASLFL